jgi:TetR/AcrR family transcriptional regulator, mexJK operon transcriptional repressor
MTELQMPDESTAPTRKDRKRAEIVATAQDLFFREGYSGTSMSQIAAAVGGSKATLYNHFQSKEELLLAVVQDVVQPRPEDYDLSTMPSEFRAWLAWFGQATVTKITSYKYVSLQRLAAGEALRFPEIGRLFYESGVMPGILMVTPQFAAAMDKGVLRRADPQVAVEQFLELCLGWMLRRMIWNIQPAPSDAEIEKTVRDAVSAFMDGYTARRDSKKK